MKATMKETRAEVIAPGDCFFDVANGNFTAWLPGAPSAIDLRIKQDPEWDLTGSKETPTLTPSINLVGIWHGFLNTGEFVNCDAPMDLADDVAALLRATEEPIIAEVQTIAAKIHQVLHRAPLNS